MGARGHTLTIELEGPLHILRLDLPSEPEPWIYAVIFAPNSCSGGSLVPHRCLGRETLKAYLEDEVGIRPEFVGKALEDLEPAGTATIPTVRLTRDKLVALDLL